MKIIQHAYLVVGKAATLRGGSDRFNSIVLMSPRGNWWELLKES